MVSIQTRVGVVVRIGIFIRLGGGVLKKEKSILINTSNREVEEYEGTL